jgi:hypothetical protein
MNNGWFVRLSFVFGMTFMESFDSFIGSNKDICSDFLVSSFATCCWELSTKVERGFCITFSARDSVNEMVDWMTIVFVGLSTYKL